MPCYDYQADDERNQIANLKERGHKLTAMLCDCCTVLEATVGIPDTTIEWWINHKTEDRKRLEQENARAIRTRALNKLTEREKEILGLT